MMLAPVRTDSSSSIGGEERTPAGDIYLMPATIRQQGFWFLDQIQPGNTAYNIAVRFRLEGPLRLPEFEHALNSIVKRHESLRTHFRTVDGVPMQVIVPDMPLPIEIDDLRGCSTAERQGRIDALTRQEARKQFNLSTGPLIRARLLRLADDDHHLLLTIHHIVADGWSIGIITDELGEFYRSCCTGAECRLPPLAVQLGDYAVWQEQWLNNHQVIEQKRFWARKLAAAHSDELPGDRSPDERPQFDSAIESRLLPRELTDRLAHLSARENATQCMAMLTALQLLVHRHTLQDDVAIGTLVAGRKQVELESLIGPLINPVVLRTNLSGNPTFADALSRVRETVLEAFANDDIPFELVLRSLPRKREWNRHPVFQVNFIYQRDFVQPFEAAGLRLSAIPSVSPGPMYDLNVFLVERAEGWRASCEYSTERYSERFVVDFLADFQAVLEHAVKNPECRTSHLIETLHARQAPRKAGSDPTPSGMPAELHAASASEKPQLEDIENRLKPLWRELLGIENVSVTGDFFDLGGHSLLAGRLLARIEKTFSVRLTITSLMASPTIETMAHQIQEQIHLDELKAGIAQLATSDVQLAGLQQALESSASARRTTAKTPLCIVDTGLMYKPLVQALGADQPVVGLALPELRSLPEKFHVGDVAAALIQEMKRLNLTPPYCLAGWSNAGIIAYEVARQLHDGGEKVAALVLFDSSSPAYMKSFEGWKRLPVRVYLKLQKYLYYFGKLMALPWRERVKYFRQKTQTLAIPRGAQPHIMFTWQMQYAVADEYQPLPADWPITLIRCTALQTGWFRDPHLGWDPLAAGGLQEHVMRGEHDTMFTEPEVQNLARVIKQSMKSCLAQTAERSHAESGSIQVNERIARDMTPDTRTIS